MQPIQTAALGSFLCLSLMGCGMDLTLLTEEPPIVSQSVSGLSDDEMAELREKEPESDLTNLHELEPGLLRGARPTEAGIRRLAAMGVKTIVNFEGPIMHKYVEQEKRLATSLGIRFIHMPMAVVRPPKLDQVQAFHRIAQDPTNRPLYFHCKLGEDRTGTMAYTYRVSVQKWPPEKAWEEMKANGFNRIWVTLQAYVFWYGKKFAPPRAEDIPTRRGQQR